jgi:hypothetical protein
MANALTDASEGALCVYAGNVMAVLSANMVLTTSMRKMNLKEWVTN